jgi:hypothetical protein
MQNKCTDKLEETSLPEESLGRREIGERAGD